MPCSNLRILQLGFVLLFPFLMVLASPEGFRGTQSVLPILMVEGVLLFGISFAAAERKLHEGKIAEEPAFKLGKATRRPLSVSKSIRRPEVAAR